MKGLIDTTRVKRGRLNEITARFLDLEFLDRKVLLSRPGFCPCSPERNTVMRSLLLVLLVDSGIPLRTDLQHGDPQV